MTDIKTGGCLHDSLHSHDRVLFALQHTIDFQFLRICIGNPSERAHSMLLEHTEFSEFSDSESATMLGYACHLFNLACNLSTRGRLYVLHVVVRAKIPV
jgi:hypothetical protein